MHQKIKLFSRQVFTLAVFLSVLLFSGISKSEKKDAPRSILSFSLENVSRFQAIIRVGREYHIPIGIILVKKTSVCEALINIQLSNVTAEQALTQVLSNSDYQWINEDGVIVVKPSTIPANSMSLLQIKFDRFTGTRTTLQGLGVILDGYIYSRLNPTQGYATDILESSDAERVEPFTLTNITVEQIANHVISLANKGTWILFPIPENREEMTRTQYLSIFGYNDDAQILSSLSCINPHASAVEK